MQRHYAVGGSEQWQRRWDPERVARNMEGPHSRQRGLPARALMTDSNRDVATTTQPTAKHTVVVPNSINMVSLLGPGDEHLGLIEQAFDADVHVRGNRITLQGMPSEIA